MGSGIRFRMEPKRDAVRGAATLLTRRFPPALLLLSPPPARSTMARWEAPITQLFINNGTRPAVPRLRETRLIFGAKVELEVLALVAPIAKSGSILLLFVDLPEPRVLRATTKRRLALLPAEFVDAQTDATITSYNPSNELPIAKFQAATEADVNIAVAAAKKAFEPGSEWRSMTGADRRDLMNKMANLVEAHRDELCKWEAIDVGKPMTQCQQDVDGVIGSWRYYAGHADKLGGTTSNNSADNDIFTFQSREAVGVCGQIIPWNFPMMMQAWKIAPAVCCGCTVVMKTSEKTPITGLLMMDLIREAGFPQGVVNLLSGDGPTCGQHIAMHPDVDKVAFTGSSAVGKSILRAAGESNLKRVTLELGGKSPLIIYDDCDMDQAIEVSELGLFANGGQCCVASSRIFVQDTIYDEFVKRAAEAANARKLGDVTTGDLEIDQGPQVDQVQFDKVMNYINIGKEEGATVAAGGNRVGDTGYFIEPTVFADVEDDMTIAREEIFGPVMQIFKFSTTEEVLQRANDTACECASLLMFCTCVWPDSRSLVIIALRRSRRRCLHPRCGTRPLHRRGAARWHGLGELL